LRNLRRCNGARMRNYLPRPGTAARSALRYMLTHPIGTELPTREILEGASLNDQVFNSSMRACVRFKLVGEIKISPRRKSWKLLRDIPELRDDDEDPGGYRKLLYRIGKNIPGEDLVAAWARRETMTEAA
jgi:hypothetical protein